MSSVVVAIAENLSEAASLQQSPNIRACDPLPRLHCRDSIEIPLNLFLDLGLG